MTNWGEWELMCEDDGGWRVEVRFEKMRNEEEPAAFLTRMFHGFPPDYQVYVQQQHARIVRRTKLRED